MILTAEMYTKAMDEYRKPAPPPILFYGGYLGKPLVLFPEGVKDGEVFEGCRHVKTKRLK